MHVHEHEKVRLRLKKIGGHVQAIERMLDEGRDCPEILLQISAVRGALAKVGRLVLEDHLDTCVVAAVEAGCGEKAIADLKESLAKFLAG